MRLYEKYFEKQPRWQSPVRVASFYSVCHKTLYDRHGSIARFIISNSLLPIPDPLAQFGLCWRHSCGIYYLQGSMWVLQRQASIVPVTWGIRCPLNEFEILCASLVLWGKSDNMEMSMWQRDLGSPCSWLSCIFISWIFLKGSGA